MVEHPRRGKRSRIAASQSGEDRRAEAVTVAWVLCIFATLLADVFALGGQLLLRWLSADFEIPRNLWLLPGLMLFTALLTGLLSVLLIPCVYGFRRTPPPQAVTVVAVLAAAVPLAVGLAQSLR